MRVLFLLIIFGFALFWWLSAPPRALSFAIPESGNAEAGAYIALASGCASCHGENYSGREALHSPFGSFYTPNITPSAYQASKEEFAASLTNGVGVNGKHLYPAFPYTSYQEIAPQDIADLYAYISALPAVDTPSKAHDLFLLVRWRRALGIWKKLAGVPKNSEPVTYSRGAYLVEVLGHCQECHTPRNFLGVREDAKAFQGGAIYGADGKTIGKAPDLVHGESTKWSKSELVSYLKEGYTPEFDTVGGAMVKVVDELSMLDDEDLEAIADYLIDLRAE